MPIHDYDTVIGLEVHVQLRTNTKLFSGASTAFGGEPNTQVGQVDLGMPGALPLPNAGAFALAIRFAAAIGGEYARDCHFDRKHYFYPDLPKGYQTSQLYQPIVSGGAIDVFRRDGSEFQVSITHAHLEEDAGKSLHDALEHASTIDLNRSGTVLLEIVTDPVMTSADDATDFLRSLNKLVRYLDVSDGDMSKGSMRCDVNVSLKPKGSQTLGERVELKNINSYRFADQAIRFEQQRQAEILDSGGAIAMETRQFDPEKGISIAMRSKETANDYRYFPCPDLPPVHLSEEFCSKALKTLPEYPKTRIERYEKDYDLPRKSAITLVDDPLLAQLFDDLVEKTSEPRLAANLLLGDFAAERNEHDLAVSEVPIGTQQLADLITAVAGKTISGAAAKQVFTAAWQEPQSSIESIIDRLNLRQIQDDDTVLALVQEVLADNKEQVQSYLDGKERVLGFLVGQLMKASRGKANPQSGRELLVAELEKLR